LLNTRELACIIGGYKGAYSDSRFSFLLRLLLVPDAYIM